MRCDPRRTSQSDPPLDASPRRRERGRRAARAVPALLAAGAGRAGGGPAGLGRVAAPPAQAQRNPRARGSRSRIRSADREPILGGRLSGGIVEARGQARSRRSSRRCSRRSRSSSRHAADRLADRDPELHPGQRRAARADGGGDGRRAARSGGDDLDDPLLGWPGSPAAATPGSRRSRDWSGPSAPRCSSRSGRGCSTGDGPRRTCSPARCWGRERSCTDVAQLLAAGLGAGRRSDLHADRPVLGHRDRRRREPAVPGAAAGEDRGQHLHDPGVRRDAAGGRGCGRWCRGSRGAAMRAFAVCLLVPGAVGAVLRRRGGADGDLNAISSQRHERAEHAARAAGRDRAAVRDAEAADSSRAGRDARRGAARRRVRLPRGQLRRRARRSATPPGSTCRAGPVAGRDKPAVARADGRQAAPEPRRSPARRQAAAPALPQPAAGAARGDGVSAAGASGAGGALGTAGTGAKTAAASANGRAYTPPPTAGSARGCFAERAADAELPRAGLRQRANRGQVPRAHQPGVGRAGQGGAAEPAGSDPSGGSDSSSQSTAQARGASRLPGDGRMVA